jgi:hypothetical protein
MLKKVNAKNVGLIITLTNVVLFAIGFVYLTVNTAA